MSILENITSPQDLKSLNHAQLNELCIELRKFIIEIVATKEGHLGASLGVIELTIALHYVFNTPCDNLIWDVGHQAYGHKIITGRKEIFDTNRRLNGISGFPNIFESEYDAFGTGHSSTSISAALGMAMASQIQGEKNKHHIAVIGDASIASGMAFEAMNHAGVTNANLLIILNDNAIGIDPSVGALKDYFTQTKNNKSYNNNIFEALNIDYSGPIDGHNLTLLIEELNRLKQIKGPKLLHITTTKGKGLKQAEEDQVTYHAPGKFDANTGNRIPKAVDQNSPPKYQDVFGKTILELAQKNEKIIGITPAMPTGSSLKYMIEALPERAFDVGIAEQHAVTLSAGMAKEGLIPFCNIYSTFLQRAYDQVIHDVALQKLPVIFCLDRAGIVGHDGATHHGVFDIPFLKCIPNLIIYAPQHEIDLRNILYTASLGLSLPIAIRYPRGKGTIANWKQPFQKIEIGQGRTLSKGKNIAVISIGTTAIEVEKAIELFEATYSQKIGHFNLQFIKPLDKNLLLDIAQQYQNIITVENGTIHGGAGESITSYINTQNLNIQIKNMGVKDVFLTHGKTQELKELTQIDSQSILKEIIKCY